MDGTWSIGADSRARDVATPRAGREARPTPRNGFLPGITSVGRGYARMRTRQLAAQDVAVTQQHQLMNLVRKAAATRFGREHGFENITGVESYQAQVPLRTYNELWDQYWSESFPTLDNQTWPGRIEYFAVSSGTSTGKLKYIPCSSEMIRSNYRAASDVVVHHLTNRPQSQLLRGKTFVMGGSTDLVKQAPGVYSGDISGIAAKNRSLWTRPFYFPPRSETVLTDWEEKMARLGPLSLREDIRAVTGGANWLLLLIEHMARMRPDLGDRIVDFYPDLEVVVHGGVSLAPYRERFIEALKGSHAELREVYPASEAFMAVADRGSGEGMRVVLDHGVFYEFVPLTELGFDTPTRHWIGNIETGVDYAVVLTTCAGLWSYVLGDVVRFVDRDPPRLLVTGRTSYFLSSFGEHVTGDLLESVVLDAAAEQGLSVNEFSVGTEISEIKGQLGRHVYVIECAEHVDRPNRAEALADAIDRLLAERNEDYRERRAVEGGIQMPVVAAANPATFNGWMKRRGKLGGQHKVPRVLGDPALFGGLVKFVCESSSAAWSDTPAAPHLHS